MAEKTSASVIEANAIFNFSFSCFPQFIRVGVNLN